MTSPIDEARLTAYALDELTGVDRSAFEARLAADPALRRAVEEIRQTAGLLRGELPAEPAPELTARQRRVLEAEAARAAPRPRRPALWAGLAAAAVVLIGVGTTVVVWLHNRPIAARQVAWDASVTAPGRDGGYVYDIQKGDKRWGDPAGPGRPGKEVVRLSPAARSEAPPDGRADLGLGTARDWRYAHSVPPLAAGTPRDVRSGGDPMIAPAIEAVDRGKTAAEYAEGGETHGVRDGRTWNREAYDRIVENPFRRVVDHPLSTFSIDVDTASYANVRRMLRHRTRPPRGAVRIEEMINYFPYAYAPPDEADKHPFAAHLHVARYPWAGEHRLVRVALKGREIQAESRPSSNFVFLLDVSGSMNRPNKLPLVKRAMRLLVDRLGENDRVAMVVYAAATGLVLDSTPCDRKEQVLAALEKLHAGGSTNGGAGIQLAYRVAAEHFITGGVNRVILCTDGDFNVGVTSRSELVRLIEAKAKSGVFLSVLGFGRGNYQDARMEQLADKGNGNYACIDTFAEARKVFVEEMTGTLVTIAKDVKIQVEFNPAKVEAYRLIGYENRILAKEDFNDDTKDAGEIGAGHTVTALYEIVPAGREAPTPKVDPLKYQGSPHLRPAAGGNEILTLKLRYKQPDGEKSTLMTFTLTDEGPGRFEAAPADFRFAASVAAFGMILRDSKHKGTYTLDAVIEQARSAVGEDAGGYRAEFVELVKVAKEILPGR